MVTQTGPAVESSAKVTSPPIDTGDRPLKSTAPLWLACVALLSISVAVHAPALRGEFVYDDADFVVNNAAVHRLGEALHQFVAPFPPEQPERALYRPVTALSYALDHAMWGLSPLGFHLSNLLLYLLTVWMVWWVAGQFITASPHKEWIRLLCAALFALHPVHSEAVDSISGRSELLALLFNLVALGLFLRWRGTGDGKKSHPGLLVASTAAYAAACFSKESAVVLFGALALWVVAERIVGRPTKAGWALMPFAAVAAGWLMLRWRALGGRFQPQRQTLAGASPWVRALTAGSVFAEYGRLLFFPATLGVDIYYEHAVGFQRELGWQSVVGWLLVTSAAFGIVRLWRGQRALAFGLLWCGLCLAPVSHLVPFGALMAERFLYAPSFGWALSMAALFDALSKRRLGSLGPAPRYVALVLVSMVLVLFSVRSYVRAQDWSSAEALWTATDRVVGRGDYRVLNNLAMAHLKSGRINKAEPLLRKSLELRPTYVGALSNLAYVMMRKERLTRAQGLLQRITHLDPNNHAAWSNLGVLAARRGDLIRAEEHFRRALAINPNSASDRKNLARVKQLLGRQ